LAALAALIGFALFSYSKYKKALVISRS